MKLIFNHLLTLSGMSSWNPSPLSSEINMEMEGERLQQPDVVDVSKETDIQKQQGRLNSQRLTVHLRPAQFKPETKPRAEKGKCTQNLHIHLRSSFQLILNVKGKISFLQWNVTGYSNQTPGQPYSNSKHTPCFLCTSLLF